VGRCLLVYDISHDRTRTRVADACLDFGLDRIQFSAFLGRLTHSQQEELIMMIQGLLGDRPGNIQLFPLCQRDWDQRLTIMQKQTVDDDDGVEEICMT